jgi:hypothetical protein
MQIRHTEKNLGTGTKLHVTNYGYLVGSHDQMSYFMVHGVTQALPLDNHKYKPESFNIFSLFCVLLCLAAHSGFSLKTQKRTQKAELGN